MKSFARPFAFILFAAALGLTSRAQPIGVDAEFSGEVLTRGPVHEAFAAVITYNPEAGILVDRPPPEPIDELPPEERPVDADTAWIPGYWAWDDERGDYIWISGTWRVLPPGRAWIAGYWRDTGRGWQWVTGYWEDAGRREVVYLAPPPETLERGPSSPQPTPNHEWVSGHWEWMDGRYFWRAGYWIEGRTDWVWVPSYYVWTPRGHVYVEGYWDYAPVERGLLFAPVYYAEHRRPRSYYRPSIVLNVAILSDYLFLRPRYSHYYFGDYYDSRYESSGFYATFDYHTSRRGYDPFYTYSRWRHRDDRDWERRYRTAYEYRRTHEDARPPRRWTGTNLTVNVNQNITNITQIGGAGSRQTVTYAQPVAQYAQVADTPLRVERVATANVQQQVQVARQVQEQRAQRRTLESQQVATSGSVQPGPAASDSQIGVSRQERSVSAQSVAPVAMPTSPIVAREGGSGRQPPPRAQGNRRDDDRQARQAGQEPARGRESTAPVDQRQPGEETVIGGTTSPRNEPARQRDRGLRADNSAAVEAQRLEDQAREQEQRQAEEARRGSAVSGQIGANPRPDLPEQASPRAMERREEAWQQADEQRRSAAETQERALEQQRQQQAVRDEQGRRDDEQRRAQQQEHQSLQRQEQAQQQAQREAQQRQQQTQRETQRQQQGQRDAQDRQAQQHARQQEADARQQQREAEFQAREQQGRAAEQARQQQAQAAEQQRAQQAQAAEQQRAQQAQAEQQARGQQRAAEQQAREQQQTAEQQAREQQSRGAQPPQVQEKASPNRGQDQQPQPKKKSKEEEEEDRRRGKGGTE